MNGNFVKMQSITLKEGQEIPLIGLGTWQAQPEEIKYAIKTALEAGCRHIDTAFNYNNEEAIGAALKSWFESGAGKREELFITTKLPHIANRPQDVSRFLKISLERLQLTYVDLYLVHMPFGFICDETTLTPAMKANGEYEIDTETDHLATWRAMEALVNEGLIKHIGLSNFNATQLRKVYENATIKPAVLQVELHLYLQQKELREICREMDIVVTAYSPLGSPGAKSHFQTKYNYTIDAFPDILGHLSVIEIAKKYNKTPAQILLRHLTQQNVVVIPKSSNAARIKENLFIFDFELDQADLESLNELDLGEKGRIFSFLFFKGIETHPEYPFPIAATTAE